MKKKPFVVEPIESTTAPLAKDIPKNVLDPHPKQDDAVHVTAKVSLNKDGTVKDALIKVSGTF